MAVLYSLLTSLELWRSSRASENFSKAEIMNGETHQLHLQPEQWDMRTLQGRIEAAAKI
jgi:hypothetical protein